MISRYSRKEIADIWELKSKFSYYLDVELAVVKAQVELGNFAPEVYENIKNTAKFDVKRIDEIERTVRHDVIAFLENVNENVGKKYSPYIHKGLTSSDVIDTAFALQIKDASKIINNDLDKLIKEVKELAIKHKNTVCLGRSHGMGAEVITFGFKLLNLLDMLNRAQRRFNYALNDILAGQISGPCGTYSNIDPLVEEKTCEILGLVPAKISTQIIARDRHAAYICAIALIGSVIENFSIEIRHLQRFEVAEVEEGFASGQKGSSAMPHKKNPISSENLSGLARILRANSISAMEDIALWHERDISHSSVERIIFPDSTILIDYMLNRFLNVIKNLVIKEENMLKNADKYGGIIYSQSCLLKLLDHNMTREEAYKIVQKEALEAFNNNGDFRENMKKHLNEEEIKDCFNQEKYLKNIDKIFERFM
ncbi:MAG: adenylosuccinate lyase [Candidatus Gastranaerophilales bacterium]|nr:adenylosuccinate lyase [Candidatus Gastranaerophilales bacterium]